MEKWKPTVLDRPDDPDGFVYHAYAVSHMRVHVREGRYADQRHAQACAESLTRMMNVNGVDAHNPHGVEPNRKWHLKCLQDPNFDESQPWAVGCIHIEDMLPEEQVEYHRKCAASDARRRAILEEAVAEHGGTICDYMVVDWKAYPRKHDPKDCPHGDHQCGNCHVSETCTDKDCGICEDRAMLSVFPQPKELLDDGPLGN